ncbi:hypothetical protein M9Y10_035450 [Tritrichomonas musculus]|uniref:RING-type E3 ubiquitin transferase n=1 Tax=Tritrichomonas musculus TaxID=1915356 RepID=A0ABR2KHT3_9EUKA
MDKDFILSLGAIFDTEPEEGVQEMKNALCLNTYKNFSQFKTFYQKNKNNRCHHFWVFPKFCVILNEPQEISSHNIQPICFNCFVNSPTYHSCEPGTTPNFVQNVKIKRIPFGKCKCGESNTPRPFYCFDHVQKQSKSDFSDETVKNVVISTFSKFNTVLSNKNEKILEMVNFLNELAQINDDFLKVVGEAVLTLKDEITKIIQNSSNYLLGINIPLCQLFLFLSFNQTFSNEFQRILLNISQEFTTICFKNVSRKIIGEASIPNSIWMELYNFSPDLSIQLLKEQNYGCFEFAKKFILHFQKEMLRYKFANPSCFPFFYKSIFKIIQAQMEEIVKNGNEDMKNWIQLFFDELFDSLNSLESNFDTKFMNYTEEDAFNKLIFMYEWTYDIVKLFVPRKYKITAEFDGLTSLSEIVYFALDCNFISDNSFDYEEEKSDTENKKEEEEEEIENSPLKKSIRSGKAKVSLFNQLINFFSFYLVGLPTPIIELKEIVTPEILLYGSIIPVRLLCWNFSLKMNLGSTLNGGGDNFFKEFNNDEKRRKLLYKGNFGFIQIASLLLDSEEREELINLIASSFGIYDECTKDNNLKEYLPTLKLCFIFFVGCLYFDRYTSFEAKIGDNDGKESIRIIEMIHRLKKENVYLDTLNRKEFESIQKVGVKRKTTNDRSIFCLKKNHELPIYWNPFIVINPINEVVSLLPKEIPSKGLLILPSVEDELNGHHINDDEDKLKGLEFHQILNTPTVYSLIYSILSDFFIEDQKNIESLHLSLNLLLIIINNIQGNVINSEESFTASNLRQLTNLASCKFEEFVVKKINFNERGEFSLYDLLLKLKAIGQPVIVELVKKIPTLVKMRSTEVENKTSNTNRARELMRTISKDFQNKIEMFKSSSFNIDLLEEEEEEDTRDFCDICRMNKENEGLCYMIYIYETSLPSLFEPSKDGKSKKVFQFSICNHLFHRNCAFKETGVPPEDDEFTCPIDRLNKNAIMPKIDGYGELDSTENYEINIFLMTLKNQLKISFEKLVISFASIFVLNEARFRLERIQNHMKYSSQILLARNLYLILWHSIHELEMTIDKSGMTLFQRFVIAILKSDFCDNVFKYRKLARNYSNRIVGVNKCLFLRRCRVFEFFIYENKNMLDNEVKLDINELTNVSLCNHFEVDDDDHDNEAVYSFVCDQFKKNLPFNYIDLCNSYSEVFNARKLSAMNLKNGSIIRNRWATTLKLLLDSYFDEELESHDNFLDMILNRRRNDEIELEEDFLDTGSDYSSEDSEIYMMLVESEFENDNENADNNENTENNANTNNNTNNTENNANTNNNTNNTENNANTNNNTNNTENNANTNNNTNNTENNANTNNNTNNTENNANTNNNTNNTENNANSNNNTNNTENTNAIKVDRASNNDNAGSANRSDVGCGTSDNNNSAPNEAGQQSSHVLKIGTRKPDDDDDKKSESKQNSTSKPSSSLFSRLFSGNQPGSSYLPRRKSDKIGETPMLLMIVGKENSKVIILYQKKFVEVKPFYVDADGEPDVGFKREEMLFFNEENYEEAVDCLLSGDFTLRLKTIYS